MQLPNTKKIVNLQIGNVEGIDNTSPDIIKNDFTEYRSPSIYSYYFETEKRYPMFVKKIERIIRSSKEMRNYMYYLKSELDMGKCYFLQGVNKDEASIELHHYPFTLFDIVDIVLQKYIRTGLNYSTADIAQEVLELHYKGLVGLVPISVTAHELAHAGELFIPLQWTHGDYHKFVKKYNIGMTSDHLEMLKKLIHLSKHIETNLAKNESLLKLNPVKNCMLKDGKPVVTLLSDSASEKQESN